MFWSKKKKNRGLPDLPAAPKAIPSMKDFNHSPPGLSKEKQEEEIHGLPSFPDSPTQKGFSQSAIKDAVSTPDAEEELPKIPAFPEEREHKLIEMEEWKPKKQIEPMKDLQPSLRLAPAPALPPPKRIIENKPIFVRLDKFQAARDSLNTVKGQLGEIEELLKNIREVKLREDHELSAWEREIETIKARIDNVNSQIFDGTQGSLND